MPILEQLEVALNGRERRAQLVAHHPQEVGLRAVRFLGRVARRLLLLEHGGSLDLELAAIARGNGECSRERAPRR